MSVQSVQMELSKIVISEEADQQVIILREVDGDRQFPIVIGSQEALAINRRLLGEAPPRPLTHDLLADAIDQLGGVVARTEVTHLRHHTFFARIHLRRPDGTTVELDCRPSDAIALGVAKMVPIFVAEDVLEEVC
jgi:bifunctional DNase/RNase